MKKYIGRRLLQLIPILLAITFLSFGMMRIAGSDVVEQKMENTGWRPFQSPAAEHSAHPRKGLSPPANSFSAH